MDINIKSAVLKASDNLSIEVDGGSPVDVFRNLGAVQEIFSNIKCGCCKNTQLRFVTRKDEEENEYFEMHCMELKCRARLPFGQNKKPKGGLYPKKRWDSLSEGEQKNRESEKAHADAHYGYLPNEGWYKYVPKDKK